MLAVTSATRNVYGLRDREEAMGSGRVETRENSSRLLCSHAELSRGRAEVQTKVFAGEHVWPGLPESEGTLDSRVLGFLALCSSNSCFLEQLFLRLWSVGAGAAIVSRKR